MLFSVEITGDELTELLDCVAEVNAERPNGQPVMTPEKYITNIAMNWLSPRVRAVMVHEARTSPISELKQKLGDFKTLKSKQKGRIG